MKFIHNIIITLANNNYISPNKQQNVQDLKIFSVSSFNLWFTIKFTVTLLKLNNPWKKSCSSITSNLELSTAWKKIKRFSGNRHFLRIPILKYNGITGTNDQHKANILANHFAAISASTHTQEFTANQHRTLHTLHKAVRETHPRDFRLNTNFSWSEL